MEIFAEKGVMKKCLFRTRQKVFSILCCLLVNGSILLGAEAKLGTPNASIVQEHVVAKGETLYGISRKYGITVDELVSANNMDSSSVLKIGQKLKIPQATKQADTAGGTKKTSGIPQTGSASSDTKASTTSSKAALTRSYDVYTVQKGDTLYRIAKVNGITVDELKKANGFTDSSVLKTGEKLKIPATIVDTSSASIPDLPSSDPRKYSARQGDSSLVWPVKNPTVTYTNGKVSGVQLSAKKNENVTAIRAGTVMYVGNYRGYGQVVFVQAKTGHIYAYTGLGSIKVKKGDYIVFGDVIGTAGTDSIKGTSQISLMVYQKSSPIDPAKAPRG